MPISFVQISRARLASGAMLFGCAFAMVAAAQTFSPPAPPPDLDGHPTRVEGGVPGGWNGAVQGAPYEGLRVDGYPSNRNLNLDDRSPRLGPTLPDRRQAAQHPHGRPGAAAPGWGALHQQPEAARGDGAPSRRY